MMISNHEVMHGKTASSQHTSAALLDVVPPAALLQLAPEQLLQTLLLTTLYELQWPSASSVIDNSHGPSVFNPAMGVPGS
jgi:hypothetical protein